MAMYSIVPPFREAKFCGVASGVFDKVGCVVGGRVCGTLLQSHEGKMKVGDISETASQQSKTIFSFQKQKTSAGRNLEFLPPY
jgi:hypothetical protein